MKEKEKFTTINTRILWVVEKKYRTKDGTIKKYRRPAVGFPFPRTVLEKLGLNVKGKKIKVVIDIYPVAVVIC